MFLTCSYAMLNRNLAQLQILKSIIAEASLSTKLNFYKHHYLLLNDMSITNLLCQPLSQQMGSSYLPRYYLTCPSFSSIIDVLW